MTDQHTPIGIARTIHDDFDDLNRDDRDVIMGDAQRIWDHHVNPLLMTRSAMEFLYVHCGVKKEMEVQDLALHISTKFNHFKKGLERLREVFGADPSWSTYDFVNWMISEKGEGEKETVTPPETSLDGYQTMLGAPSELAIKIRALDVSSGGMLEIITDDTISADDCRMLAEALSSELERKGIAAIIHSGNMDIKPIAPGAVPRLKGAVEDVISVLSEEFDKAPMVSMDEMSEEATLREGAASAAMELLEQLYVEIGLAGIGNIIMLVNDAPIETRAEANKEALRLAEALGDTDYPLLLKYDNLRTSKPWTAAVVGVWSFDSDTPAGAVTGLLSELFAEFTKIAGSVIVETALLFRVVTPAFIKRALELS